VENLGSEKITHSQVCHIVTSNSVKQHKLRKRIAWLSSKERQEDDLVSVYIPSNTTIENVLINLKSKSKSIHKERDSAGLEDTIKNIIQHLKQKNEIAENGQALFAGSIVEDDNEVFVIEEIVPPEKIGTYFFEFSGRFHLEPLRQMLRNPRIVGFIVLDSKEASFGLLNGEVFEFVKNISSGISGKSGKGGQSQRRYERERDMELVAFFHRVAEYAAKEFLEKIEVMALIVGGPSTTKNSFVSGNYLHYQLKEGLLSVFDTQTVGKEGLNELLSKSSETLKNMCFPEERTLMRRLLQELHKQNGLIAYGLQSVLTAINNGAVDIVLATDTTNFVEIAITCKKCGSTKKKMTNISNKLQTINEMASASCGQCSSKEYEVEERDIIDVLEDAASKTDAKVEVISTDSEEKNQLTLLGGVAAILRYKPAHAHVL
jgi:peptide chain release factor subunit 1